MAHTHVAIRTREFQEPKYRHDNRMICLESFQEPYTHTCHKICVFYFKYVRKPIQNRIFLHYTPYQGVNFLAS